MSRITHKQAVKMANEAMSGVQIVIAGNSYTVWHNNGVITDIACKYRWAKAPIEFLGDKWLENELQKELSRTLEEQNDD
jgi:hypothetical protein